MVVEDFWADGYLTNGSNVLVIHDGNSVDAESFTPLLSSSRDRTYRSTTGQGLLLNIYAAHTEISFEYRMVDTAGKLHAPATTIIV